MSLLGQSRVARFVPTLAILLSALSTTACDEITGLNGNLRSEQRQLTRARADWNDVLIRNYEYVVRRDCYCSLSGVAVRVTVRNDQVVALTRDATGESIALSYVYDYPTIDGLFSRVQRAIDDRAYRVEASYDTQYGFPTDVYVDLDRRVADDDEGYTLFAFRRL